MSRFVPLQLASADRCTFTHECTGCRKINNQGEQRVADQLCIGLADADIQEDLLKDPNQAMTVEETIRFVEIRAAGKVPLGTPVTWCPRMVICTKKNGSLRRTINFQPLNRAVPRLTKKTVFDAWNGYHSVALEERHRHFTTFITPWGTSPPLRATSPREMPIRHATTP